MTLTTSQVEQIKASVPALQEHGNVITALFYKTMLTEHKELNNVFNQTNQANGSQPAALAAVLAAYAIHIDDLGVLDPAIEKICHKHASLYITPEQYDTVGEYLLRAMKEVLGDALTPELHDAWAAAYWQLANLMIMRERKLLEHAHGWTDWRDLVISDKQRESEEICSFRLARADGQGLPLYKPGQYISVMTRIPKLGYLQSRQYSLSDAPDGKTYRISVKKEVGLDLDAHEAHLHPGYLSNVLHDEKEVGDVLQVSHPEGTFYLDVDADTDAPVDLISAGVGITPMISILNTLVGTGSKRQISFIHASRSSEAQAFGHHVRNEARKHDNVHAVEFNRRPAPDAVQGVDYQCTSRLSLDALDDRRDLFTDDPRTQYFVCGPETFMKDMAAGLDRRGVDKSRINLELFGTGSIPS